MIGESMFNFEDENTDLIMEDPMETDIFFMMTDEEKEHSKGKDSATKDTSKEESVSKEESSTEEAPDEEVVEEVSKDKESIKKPEMNPEEATYVAQQTRLYQATYLDMRKDLPKFRSGDKVSVGYRVIEGERSRIQNFDGVVIKISAGHGMDKTFTVRKVSSGIGVERIFPFHSPNIESIEILKQGKVRRAKLYYLRNRVGKATRIKELTSQ